MTIYNIVKRFPPKMPTLIINKYILTENARASKKNTAHTWRQEMRYTQSKGQPKKRSSSTHNGSSKSRTNQSDSRLSSGRK